VARDLAAGARRALAVVAPWASLAVLPYVAGVWLCFQPMQMRGTMLMAH
jgi:hypothetical protein